jgi:hypothetical protein
MSTQDIRGTSSVNSGALNRRDVLLASTSVVVASALGSTALMPITQAQARGAQSGAETPITEQEAHAIGVNAYLYFYSLVTMDISRRVATNVEAGKIPGLAPLTGSTASPRILRRTSKASFAQISIHSTPVLFST